MLDGGFHHASLHVFCELLNPEPEISPITGKSSEFEFNIQIYKNKGSLNPLIYTNLLCYN